MNKIIRNALASGVALALAGCAIVAPRLQVPQQAAPVAASINTQPAQVAEPKPNGATWKPELFLAWPKGYTSGPVAYDMTTGAQQFALPAGRADALGKLYFGALLGSDETTIKTYTLHDGHGVGTLTLKGQWGVVGVSANGLWVAVARMPSADEWVAWTKQRKWQTDVQVIDTNNNQVKHTLKLDGNFEVETISNDGQSLFLLEHLPAANANPHNDAYNVRLFNLWTERMNEYPLRQKGSDEVMAGYAHDVVASTDGEWLMTLYLNSTKKEAFIHALLLNYQFPVCIDLPSGDGDVKVLREYRLRMSADNKRLYAANAALGVVVEIGLDDSTYPPYQVLHIASFDAVKLEAGTRSLYTHSAWSVDGKTLYFTSADRTWAYDTAARKVTGLAVTGDLNGIGTSSDGQRVIVARENAVVVLDAVSGTMLNFPVAAR